LTLADRHIKAALHRIWSEGKGVMLDSARYGSNAAECLLAVMEAKQSDYCNLHLALARSWTSLARENEAVATILAIWQLAECTSEQPYGLACYQLDGHRAQA
jgi:hypothetical protein